MPNKELTEKLAAKSAALHKVFEEAGPGLDMSLVKSIDGDSAAKVEKIAAMEKELGDLHDEFTKATNLESTARRVAELNAEFNKPATGLPFPGKDAGTPQTKTFGQLFMASAASKNNNTRVLLDIDSKNLLAPETKGDFFTTSGWAPENLRQPGYVPSATRPPAVVDYLPIFPTTQNSVVYMLETTFTNSAAEKSEGAAAPESALVLTETSEPVQEVATFIPTSKVQLEDVAFAEAYLTARLNFMVRQKMSYQILNGSGTPPALKGTLNIGGSLQTQALGSDPLPDAIYKGFTKIRTVGYTEPSILFAHPNDWQTMRLLKTADGVYIYGSPEAAGPARIWGVPVVETADCAENTMITGDYSNFAYIAMRRGVEVEMSSGYSDYFVKGKLAVLASLRCAVVHTRTSAFCTITGV
jgi:hypothetical protein